LHSTTPPAERNDTWIFLLLNNLYISHCFADVNG
jgi:hypothetical protein